jgi:hypothetical protein
MAGWAIPVSQATKGKTAKSMWEIIMIYIPEIRPFGNSSLFSLYT